MSTETPETEETPTPEEDRLVPVKLVADLIVGKSVTSVIKNLIAQNVVLTGRYASIELTVASYVLGGLVAKHGTDYAEDQIDKLAGFIAGFKKKVKAASVEEEPVIHVESERE